MPMVKRTVTAKSAPLGVAQVDNAEWVKMDKEKLAGVNVGDTVEVSDAKPQIEDRPTKVAAAPKKSDAFGSAEKTDWAAKDRSQLVGGRSHDAVVLVQTSLSTCTEMSVVLELYKEALQGILKVADEVK